eukprot:12104355-Alexandrium_andersonii.AAC.1
MSASLVGSEMCIRDSREHRRPHDSVSGASSGRFRFSGCVAFDVQAWERACLLYTSDAADDM